MPVTYNHTYPATAEPADKWHTIVLDKDLNELGSFEASLDYDLADTTTLDVKPGIYKRSGAVDVVKVYKNGALYAKLKSTAFVAVLINQTEHGGALVISAADRVIGEPAKIAPVCTCGGWAVYGKEADLHVDNNVAVCDLRRKT